MSTTSPTSQPAKRPPLALAPFRLPLWLALTLDAIAVALQILNQTTFGIARPWSTLILVGLVFLAGIGIKPSDGATFAARLHLPAPVAAVISAAMAAGALGCAEIPHGSPFYWIGPAVLTFLAGLGFATSGAETPLALALKQAPAPAPVGNTGTGGGATFSATGPGLVDPASNTPSAVTPPSAPQGPQGAIPPDQV